MTKNSTIDIERLMRLEPLSALSNERLDELAKLAYVERVSIGVSLFREGDLDNQTLYLLQGDVQLSSSDGSFDEVVSSRHNTAKFPLDDSQPRQVSCVALGLVEFLRIDNSVLDYMMMWDQLAVQEELLENRQSGSAAEEQKSSEQSAKDGDEEQSAEQVTSASANSTKKDEVAGESDSLKTDEITNKQSDADHASELKAVQPAEPALTPAEEERGDEEESPTEEIPLVENSLDTQIAVDEPATESVSETQSHAAQETNKMACNGKELPLTHHATEAGLIATGTTNNNLQNNPPAEKGAWMRRMRHIMAFKNLPPANIKELLERMESVKVKKGDTIVQQGEPGDTFYVLTDGQAQVTRTIELAVLQAGASFGEESLVSGAERNASITMKTDGVLMRLSKQDFDQLLKEPMLNRISPDDARIRSYKGDQWLDVRHASEYHHSHLRKATNIPLHEIRMRMGELNKTQNYICYCNTGRRSSAAAFILAQAGYKVSVLNGGVRVMPQDLVSESK